MPDLPHVHPGDPTTKILSSEWNERADRAEQAGNTAFGGGMSFTTGGPNRTVARPRPPGFWARLSAGPAGNQNPYGFAELAAQPDGTFAPLPGGFTGKGNHANDPTDQSAYEVNGVQGLAGKNLYLTLGAPGDWRGQWVAYGKPSACSTTITVHVLDMFGGTDRFCPRPPELDYVITGADLSGHAITPITGSSTSGGDFGITLDQSQLPEGHYQIHVYEVATFCRQPSGPTGRFDVTAAFDVVCPKTTVTVTVQEQWQVAVVTSSFGIKACDPTNSGIAFRTPVSIAVAITGPATECARTINPYVSDGNVAGNVSVFLKVTGYPWSIKFSASGSHLLPADETRTCTACGAYTSDWLVSPYTWYDQYPIKVVGCSTCDPAAPSGGGQPIGLPGATVTLSNGVTGTGTTGSDGTGIATLTAFVQDKVGTDPSALLINWQVTAPRFVGASYTQAAYQAAVGTSPPYPGTLCPAGGSPGAVASGYACGGCAIPVSTTLHASTLGESYQLTWSANHGWTGGFTHPILSRACKPFGQQPVNSTGPVSFFVGFTCVTVGGVAPHPSRPNRTIWYYGDADGNPSQCPAGGSTPFQANTPWYTITADSTYAANYTASCTPFSGEEDVRWTYLIGRTDGSGNSDSASIEVDFTVSE